jgi:hypothetical protein
MGKRPLRGESGRPQSRVRRFSQLEGKLREKDEVLAEIAAEMVRLKKELGGS